MSENYEKYHMVVCVFLGILSSTIRIKSGEHVFLNGDGNLQRTAVVQ